MFRLRLPQLLSDKDEMNISPKADDDQMMGNGETKAKYKMGKLSKGIEVDIDWNAYTNKFQSIPRENLTTALTETLFQVKTLLNGNALKNFIDESGRDSFIRSATIQLMSTPEYQMC